ncbi:hypothetical protein G6F62_011100 [Rhizopus arrhizus]|nr:hypothetical protein G6F62_011100 [Rhizopus arrhizus]
MQNTCTILFTVYTDQKSLQFLVKFNEDAAAKILRWQASLLAYDFDIIYRPGKLNANADALSRLSQEYSHGPDLEEIIGDYYLPLNMIRDAPEDGFAGNEEPSNKREKLTNMDDLLENQIVGTAGMSLEEYHAVYNFIVRWKYPEHFNDQQRKGLRHKARMYEVYEDELYKRASGNYGRRKVVVSSEVLKVLKENHDHVLVGHQGVSKTFERIKHRYYWQGYYDTVRSYVLSCPVCQHFGPRNPPVPLNPSQAPTTGVFGKVSIDYVYLPVTRRGCNAALVMIDYLSGWVDAEPVSTQSASTTGLILFKWICQYGLMSQIICDNGPHFSATEIKAYMEEAYGISLTFGVPHRPQRQGKVERANQTIKTLLKKYAMSFLGTWDDFLPAALYVIRTSIKVDHSYCPYFLLYGRQPRIPKQHLGFENDIFWDEEDLLEQRIKEIVKLNEQVIPQAIDKINLYQKKMKEQYDKRAKARRYIVGDQVMVEDRSPILYGNTLIGKWLGPFHIHEKLKKDTYRIRDGELLFPTPYHANQMKLYKARPKIYIPLKFYSKAPKVAE